MCIFLNYYSLFLKSIEGYYFMHDRKVVVSSDMFSLETTICFISINGIKPICIGLMLFV